MHITQLRLCERGEAIAIEIASGLRPSQFRKSLLHQAYAEVSLRDLEEVEAISLPEQRLWLSQVHTHKSLF